MPKSSPALHSLPSHFRDLSENSKDAVGSARENDEGIHRAIDNITTIIDNFNMEIKGLMDSVEAAVSHMGDSSENSNIIQSSMLEYQLGFRLEEM